MKPKSAKAGLPSTTFGANPDPIKSGAGFTLIELLVVIAIIGLLASVVLVAMGNARIKSRDGKRLSDIQQIKSGLEVHYSIGGGYPATADWDTAQNSGGSLVCSGQQVMAVPQDIFNSTNPAFDYVYTQGGSTGSGCGTTVYTNYKLQFTTEGVTSLGPAGTYFMAPAGITTTPLF